MTKLLTFDVNSGVPYLEATLEMNDLLQELFLDFGVSEAHRWEPVHVSLADNFESLAGLSDFISTAAFRIVSRHFADVLRGQNCECEFLPLVVYYHNQTLEGEFFAMNALRVVKQAIDLGQSTIGYYDAEFQTAEDIEKLVLKPEALGEAPLCYLSEISHYAVSDELAASIAAAGLIGIELMDPTKFSSC